MGDVIFLDTETTGLDYDTHSIWEVALIDDEGEVTYQLAVDLARADSTALRLNGFYDRFGPGISTRAKWGEDEKWTTIGGGRAAALTAIAQRSAGKTICGSAPWFDTHRLERAMRLNGICPAWSHRLIDTTTLAAGHLGEYVPGLTEVYRKVTKKSSPVGRHSALVDARMAKDVYDAILGGGA